MLAGELTIEGQERLFIICFGEKGGIAIYEGERRVRSVEIKSVKYKRRFRGNIRERK